MKHTFLSRDEAQLTGKKRFYTGGYCRRGHDAERFTSNGGCTECINRRVPNQNLITPVHGLPETAMFFGNVPLPAPSMDEIRAAFRYIEYAGWHEQALMAIRADPHIMEAMTHTETAKRLIKEAYGERYDNRLKSNA